MTVAMAPYHDVADWARQQEELVVLQLEAFALRDMASGRTADPVKVAETIKSPAELASFVAALRTQGQLTSSNDELDQLRRVISARAAETTPRPPLDVLAERLQLMPLELDVLRLLWVLQTSPAVHRFAQALWHDLAEGPIGLDFVIAALTTRSAERLRLRNALAQSGPLRRWSLVIATNHRSAYPTLALPEGLLTWLAGAPLTPSGPYRILHDAPIVQPERLVTEARWPALQAALAPGKKLRLLLQAPSGSGVETLVRGLAWQAGAPLVVAEARALLQNRADADQLLDHALRDAILAGGWLCLEVPTTWEAGTTLFVDRAEERFRDAPVPVVVVCEIISPPTRELTRDYTSVDIGTLSTEERGVLWRDATPVDASDASCPAPRAMSPKRRARE